jgi:hypothetical protein
MLIIPSSWGFPTVCSAQHQPPAAMVSNPRAHPSPDNTRLTWIARRHHKGNTSEQGSHTSIIVLRPPDHRAAASNVGKWGTARGEKLRHHHLRPTARGRRDSGNGVGVVALVSLESPRFVTGVGGALSPVLR